MDSRSKNQMAQGIVGKIAGGASAVASGAKGIGKKIKSFLKNRAQVAGEMAAKRQSSYYQPATSAQMDVLKKYKKIP